MDTLGCVRNVPSDLQGRQFVDQDIVWLKSAIKSAKVWSSTTFNKVPLELPPGGSSDGNPSNLAM